MVAPLKRPARGQVTVEFTIVAIFTLLLLVAMVNLFLIMLGWMNAQFAAREGARASVPIYSEFLSVSLANENFFMGDCVEGNCNEGCCVRVKCKGGVRKLRRDQCGRYLQRSDPRPDSAGGVGKDFQGPGTGRHAPGEAGPIMIGRPGRRSGAEGECRGQSALEFTLLIPFVLALLLTVIEIGNYLRVGSIVSTVCHETARRGMRFDLRPHELYSNLLSDAPPLGIDTLVLIHYLRVTDAGVVYHQVYFDREEVECYTPETPCRDCLPPCCEGPYCSACEEGGAVTSCMFPTASRDTSVGRDFRDRLGAIEDELLTMERERFIIVEIFHIYKPLVMPGVIFGVEPFGLREIYNYSALLIEY